MDGECFIKSKTQQTLNLLSDWICWPWQEFGRNPRQARRAEQSPCLLFQVISADSHTFLFIQHVLYNPDIYDLHRIQQMTSDLQCDL